MGTISKGILGGFSGKVGTVVGANWRGMDVIRSVPKKIQRTPTESQMIQRLKFALVTQFLAPVGPLTRSWYGQPSGVKSRRNLAVSYHIKEAVTGVNPDFMMDYVKVIMTKGELPSVQEPDVVPAAGALLGCSWEDNSDQGLANPDDLFLIVIYNETRKLFDYQHTAARSALSFNMQLPATWTGEEVQCWVSFISADEKKQANSIYMGAMVLL